MLDLLQRATKRSIGSKQTAKALERDIARVVFVARDAEAHVIKRIIDECAARSVDVVYVDTMSDLGRACGIQVGAASAALLDD